EDVMQALARPSVCDGVADCRRATRHAIKMGADVIKITATGGVLSNTAAGTSQQFTKDELEAIVQAAHMMGREVTAHAHGKDGIDSALKAGINSIEHGSYLDVQSTELFKQHKAMLIPTVLAGMTVVEWAKTNNWLPPASKAKALKVGPQMLDMLHIAYSNGVTIAFGTDSGVSKHGQNAHEFGYMVEAGMSEMDAIKAATLTGAKHLGMSKQIGTLAPGKFADLIAVRGNPLEDITKLQSVDFVMKGGVVYKGGK
ncbi:MAG TPA: amidohydrolase family protein, partial [Hellea balneolensis]|nr:amidohydrolase family protein [Hellea balneolensis]